MAHKKGASSTRNGRDSNSQRLGVKRFGGQLVSAVAAMTPCSPWSRGMSSSALGEAVESST